MNTALDMFRSTLRSMFMIDSAEELDFGIYRIMRIKKQEIENWLNIRLEEIVKEQITSNMSSDYGEKKVRLDEKVNSMRNKNLLCYITCLNVSNKSMRKSFILIPH